MGARRGKCDVSYDDTTRGGCLAQDKRFDRLLLLAVVLAQVAVGCGGEREEGRVRDSDTYGIEVLSPANGSVLYFGDETTKISYRTVDLPAGAQVVCVSVHVRVCLCM